MKTNDRLIIFDGACGLCHAWVRFGIRHDKHRIFRFTAIQSEMGQVALKTFDQPTDVLASMVYVENNIAYVKSQAFLKIIRLLPWSVRWLASLAVFPGFVRDFVYDRIANNRYRIFGIRDICLLTDGSAKDRFL